jgi:hypothetical protein
MLKRTVIALACATALAGLTSAPSFAGVITPTDKPAVSTGSPIDSVYYGGCPWRRHHYYHWRGCHSAWNYPVYTYVNPYPAPYPVAGCGGWGGGCGGWGGWGGGGLLGAGLFGIL